MRASIPDTPKKRGRGRPKGAGRGEGVMVRFHQGGLLEQLDAWIAKQDDAPSRPEAIRRLLAKALGKVK
jgi:uncharacterized protein YidB (DUF937 family)